MNLGRTYAIVSWSDVTDAMSAESSIENKEDLRRSVFGSDRAIVSWTDSIPVGLESHQTYSHSEIKAIVDDESGDWFKDITEDINPT